jgi:pimeloyl-ACP methyl ester carboxylesterase
MRNALPREHVLERSARHDDRLQAPKDRKTSEGDANGAPHAPDASAYRNKFTGKYEHREITGGVGHNLPQEAPQAFAQAIVDVDGF